MWNATFHLSDQSNSPGNNYGFTLDKPFCVAWAREVNTSLPATRYGPKGGRVKMLFESRYGTNKLNMGFNPYVQDFMFNRSYVSLVRLLAGNDTATAVEAAIRRDFPDNPKIKQNFTYGPH